VAKKPWHGRFEKRTHELAERFSASIEIDKRLYREDIEGSIAHAKMLGKTGIISSKESEKIIKGLMSLEREIEKGKFPFRAEYEDIHLNIEKRLIEKIGRVGGKLHTARSRNDQIVLDMRLYLRREIGEILLHLKLLSETMITLAERNISLIMPLYTHLQRAQPVLLSLHLMAYFEMFKRQRERYLDCQKRVNIMPLGTGAGAGTSFPIDRNYVAKLLGFRDVTKNSIDSVSDRDFIIEFIATSSSLMMHLSRLSEELVLWSSKEFDFVDLGDGFTTGSSIMPQKRNPDIAELIRGKTGRVYGNLISILTVMKGLPLSYNRDMQEDKEPMFDTIDTVKSCLKVLTGMLHNIKFNSSKMEKALSGGHITATDLADYLSRKGIPFREAHEITGKIVRYADRKGKDLLDLSISELKKFSRIIEDEVFKCLTINGSIASRTSDYGTSEKNVLKMIEEGKKDISKW
jgi:argininosuccinate lyase